MRLRWAAATYLASLALAHGGGVFRASPSFAFAPFLSRISGEGSIHSSQEICSPPSSALRAPRPLKKIRLVEPSGERGCCLSSFLLASFSNSGEAPPPHALLPFPSESCQRASRRDSESILCDGVEEAVLRAARRAAALWVRGGRSSLLAEEKSLSECVEAFDQVVAEALQVPCSRGVGGDLVYVHGESGALMVRRNKLLEMRGEERRGNWVLHFFGTGAMQSSVRSFLPRGVCLCQLWVCLRPSLHMSSTPAGFCLSCAVLEADLGHCVESRRWSVFSLRLRRGVSHLWRQAFIHWL